MLAGKPVYIKHLELSICEGGEPIMSLLTRIYEILSGKRSGLPIVITMVLLLLFLASAPCVILAILFLLYLLIEQPWVFNVLFTAIGLLVVFRMCRKKGRQ